MCFDGFFVFLAAIDEVEVFVTDADYPWKHLTGFFDVVIACVDACFLDFMVAEDSAFNESRFSRTMLLPFGETFNARAPFVVGVVYGLHIGSCHDNM